MGATRNGTCSAGKRAGKRRQITVKAASVRTAAGSNALAILVREVPAVGSVPTAADSNVAADSARAAAGNRVAAVWAQVAAVSATSAGNVEPISQEPLMIRTRMFHHFGAR